MCSQVLPAGVFTGRRATQFTAAKSAAHLRGIADWAAHITRFL